MRAIVVFFILRQRVGAIKQGDAACCVSTFRFLMCLGFVERLDFVMRLKFCNVLAILHSDLSMSDNGRQMVSAMYYFAPRSCAIFIDSKSRFRLYFVAVICRERRRRKPLQTGIVGLLANRGNPKRPATYASMGPSLGSRIACFRTR